MNSVSTINTRTMPIEPMISKSTSLIQRHWQAGVLMLLMAAVNWPMVMGGINVDLIFFPHAVADGQWWRLLTFPLVHVSWYHLLLDGGAFLLLYLGLNNRQPAYRLGCVAGAGLGSLALALALAPSISFRGLCGLSGIAHGLMAVSSLEMIADTRHRSLGLVSFLLVASKSAWELCTGQVMFAWLHIGDIGTPLAACHGGGVLGAVLTYGAIRFHRYRQMPSKKAGEAGS